MDAEWALFAQMRAKAEAEQAGEKEDNAAEAEARFLSFGYVKKKTGVEGQSLTWEEYQDVYLHFFRREDEHHCARDSCHYEESKWGQAFRDPANPKKVYVATGIVYVCQTTGRVHICDDDCTEQMVNTEDAGTIVCPISGRFKGSLINSHESYFVSDHQVMMEGFYSDTPKDIRKRSNADGNKLAGKRNRASSSKSVNRRERPDLSQTKDAHSVCHELICSGVLRKASLDRLVAADQQLEKDVRLRARRGEPVDALQLAMMTSLAVLPHFGSATRLAQWTGTVSADVVEYLERCLLWMFYLAREAPGAREGGNDINLRKMCFAMAYILRQGLVGYAQFPLDTHKPNDWGLMREGDPWQPEPKPGYGWERYVFVAAHPGLRNILPDKNALPYVAGFESDMAKLMKRTRRLEGLFLSVLRDGTSNVAKFCLSSYMDVRPTILCD